MSDILAAEEEHVEEEIRVDLPRWVDALVIPVLNVSAALAVSAIIILMLGENPFAAVYFLVRGAFGYQEAIGYTLFYATSFTFTGLAVAVAFHCGLLNLGGEGQAYVGGLGIGFASISLGHMPLPAVLLMAVMIGALLGAVWGAIPGYLQGARGSHIVITTIMFNFLASSLAVYVIVNYLVERGQSAAETPEFPESAWLTKVHELLAQYGYEFAASPLNVSILLAVICAVAVWLLLWHTPLGYEIRVVGKGHMAAIYAGISPTRSIVIAMSISGALAAMLGINELMGSQHRLALNFVAGYGIAGVAVALMGRNHPFGIFLSALLFGALYQGGAELSFEIPTIPREMVILIQGLIILFSGALEHLFRPHLATLWHRRRALRDLWVRQKQRMREQRERRRLLKRLSGEQRRTARAQAKAAAAAGKVFVPEPPPPPEKEGTLDRVRERGEAEYQDILRKSGQLHEQPEDEGKPKRRSIFAKFRLPKLPKIRISLESDDEDEA